MNGVTGIANALRTLSLATLGGAGEVRPVAPVRRPLTGDVLLQPDTYERGTREQPLPVVTYTARCRSCGD